MSGGWWRPVDLHRRADGSLGRRGATSFIGLTFQGLLRLAVNVLIGRWAGAAVLGVVAAGQATAQFLILLWPTTSGQAASRFLARARGRGDADEIDAVAHHLGRAFVVATLVLAALSVPVSLARGVSPTGTACVAALLVGLAGQQYTRGVHYGVGAVTRVVALDIGFSLLGLAGVAAALLAGVRDLRLLLPLALAFWLLTAACWPRGGRPATTTPGLAREINTFVFFGSLGTLASAGLVQLSVLVASRLGDTDAGTYSAASNLAIPLTLLSGSLSLVLYPSMAEAFGRGDEAAVRSQLDRGVRGLVFLVVPIVAAAALFAPEIVALLYGPGFDASAGLLVVLLLAVLVSMVAVPCVNATTSGHARGIVEMSLASLAGLAVAALTWWLLLGAGGGGLGGASGLVGAGGLGGGLASSGGVGGLAGAGGLGGGLASSGGVGGLTVAGGAVSLGDPSVQGLFGEPGRVVGVALGYLAGVTVTGGYAFVRSWRAWRMRWWPVLIALVAAVGATVTSVAVAGDTSWGARAGLLAVLVLAWLVAMPGERRAWLARLRR